MIVFLILLLINVIFDIDLIYESMFTSLYIWLIRIVPSFFIFYILSTFLLRKNILSKISFILKPFFSFEKDKSYDLLLLSFLISNPTTIKQAKIYYEDNIISFNDYKKIIYLSMFSNPLFLLSFFDIKTVLIFIFIQFICIFIIDKKIRLKNSKDNSSINNESNSFFIINKSLNDVIYIILLIASSICFVNLIKTSIINIFNLLNISNIEIYLSIFEITSGIISLQGLDINHIFLNSILLFIISFQGIAINLQNYCIINNKKINYKKAIIVRFIESLIASIIYLLFSYIATSLLP